MSKDFFERDKELIFSFEEHIKNNTTAYFDVEDFLIGIDFFFENKRINKASKLLEMALNQHVLSVDLFIRKAQILVTQKKYNEALSCLEKGIQIEPSNTEILLVRGDIYSSMKNHAQAIINYEKYIHQADTEEEFLDTVYIDLAWEYEAIGQNELSLNCLIKAIEINPKEDMLLYEIAHFYEMANRSDEGVAFFQKYLDENPYSVNAWYNLGVIYLGLELYEKAIDSFDFCIAIEDNSSSAHFNKGNAYFKLEQYENAIQSYIETFQLEEPHALTYCYIGECYEKMEQFDLAMDFYHKALDVDPKIGEALVGIGVTLSKLGQTINAISFLQKAIELYPTNFEYWRIIGKVYEIAEMIDEADASFKEAIKLNELDTKGHIEYSNFLAEHFSIDKAISIIENAFDILDLPIDLEYQLAGLQFLNENHEKAKVHLEKAYKNDSNGIEEWFENFDELKDNVEILHFIKELKK